MNRDEKEQITVLGDGDYFRFVRKGDWEYVEPKKFSDVVMLVPIKEDGTIILVEQFRVPVNSRVIEIPAGLVGDDEDKQGECVITAGQRELLEETGYEADNLEIILRGAPSAGSNSLVLTFVLATGLRKVGPGGGVDHNEDITVHEVPLAEIDQWLAEKGRQGYLVDLKLYTGLYLADRWLQANAKL